MNNLPRLKKYKFKTTEVGLTPEKNDLVRKIWSEMLKLGIADYPTSYTNVWTMVAGGATKEEVISEAQRRYNADMERANEADTEPGEGMWRAN